MKKICVYFGYAFMLGGMFMSTAKAEDAMPLAERLYQTACTTLTQERRQTLFELQSLADSCSMDTFQRYLSAGESASEQMEKAYPILQFYIQACEKVLREVRTQKVPRGHVYIWCLYNMGYVIKTPSVCFGVDLNHKYAERFEPLIDFLCVTHAHDDHRDTLLNRRMWKAGKPVLSNFFAPDSSYPYLSKTPKQYSLHGIRITTQVNDHNSKLRNFVLTYQFDCGADANHAVLMHVGDSSFNPKQYSVETPIDVFIPRYAPTIDSKIIGPVIQPKVILMAHILEMRHRNVPGSRSSISQALEHIVGFTSSKAYFPFWGERFDFTR